MTMVKIGDEKRKKIQLFGPGSTDGNLPFGRKFANAINRTQERFWKNEQQLLFSPFRGIARRKVEIVKDT